MSVRELVHYSGKLLKGRCIVTALICLMPLFAELFFRLGEALFYSILLYFGGSEPLELFSSGDPVRLGITAGFTLARWLAAAPLTYISAYRLCEICSEGEKLTPMTEVLISRRCIRRSLAALLWTKSASLLALVPTAFFGITAYTLFTESSDASRLFMTVHAFTLTLVSLGLWLSLKLTFAAVPYLLAERPELSAFSAVRLSLKFMKGRKGVLLRLIIISIPALATVIAVPAVITVLRTSFALSIHIGIKEEEYLNGTEAEGHNSEAPDPPELSSGTKRRFKTAADQA